MRSSHEVLAAVQSQSIIADRFDRTERAIGWIVFGVSVVAGAAAAWHYAQAGLTLSHYDARSHLVVARRVIDSLTPGWRQLGASWLPLPHLLNLLPVQARWNFETGFSAVCLSVLSLALGLSALGRYLVRHTRSAWMAVAAPLTILLNPDVLYLQSTPLTEPLLFGFALASLVAVDDWVVRPYSRETSRAGLLLAGLVLVRYAGWFIAATLVALAALAQPRWRSAAALAAYPIGAVAVFLGLSYASSGVLLVTSGFFKPDNPALGRWSLALDQVVTDAREILGPAMLTSALLGGLIVAWRVRETGRRSLLPLSLAATAVLPLAAFHSGHPERVRYMVSLVVAGGTLAAFACCVLPRPVRGIAAVMLLGAALLTRPPLLASAPMVVEAQWELPLRDARRTVTAYLHDHYDGTPILASMSSLAHYMQETSAVGMRLVNFVHEGNGDLWRDAFGAPQRHVRWILIEEQAYGGDNLAVHARENPAFLAGFTRVIAAGGVALYERTAEGKLEVNSQK